MEKQAFASHKKWIKMLIFQPAIFVLVEGKKTQKLLHLPSPSIRTTQRPTFGAVWPLYSATKSARETSTKMSSSWMFEKMVGSLHLQIKSTNFMCKFEEITF